MSLSEKEIAQALLENMGGKENITDLERCGTRLRFKLKKAARVHEENIKRLNGIIGIIEADHQFYIVPEVELSLNIYNELAASISLPQAQPLKQSLVSRIRDTFRWK